MTKLFSTKKEGKIKKKQNTNMNKNESEYILDSERSEKIIGFTMM